MLIKQVLQCNLLQNIKRDLTMLTTKFTRDRRSYNEDNLKVDEVLVPEVLLSEGNKQRAMQCMQKIPNFGSKLTRESSQKAAAVLICLCTDEKNEISILYTRRSGLLTRHVRQISFPDCALRETEEEIGLPRKRIHVWGCGSLITPQHTAAIMPVVASVDGFNLKELRLNADEVDEAFLVKIKELVHPITLRHTQFKSGWSSPNFLLGQNRIWGITGFITNGFLRCLIPMDLKRLKHHMKYVRPFKHKT
ncbi:mitochondrial coenzyme A diphosphatase NUDT8 isoform X2 [Eurosta solidaginis]|uniref:mitochondrial coenzyme A diphosphatase NUDT8 isoform X2 n=1 Tax=Eurosta solidaginis TaxID=178769 RepID=UPI003530C03A